MERLRKLVLDSENWLIDRVIEYAKRFNYTKYTSTLREAWKISISGLTTSIITAIDEIGHIPEMGPDHNFTEDAIASFGIVEARKHRNRGITLGMFVSLMKYYRQSYIDLVKSAGFEKSFEEYCEIFVERCFDHIEIGFCSEWSNISSGDIITGLQNTNRFMINEKNKYLTIFESLPNPVIILDKDNVISDMNYSASQLFQEYSIPGSSYYSRANTNDPLYWIEEELKQFINITTSKLFFGKELQTKNGTLYFEVKLMPMLDVSEKFSGTIVILDDVTKLKKAEFEAKAASEAKSQFLANMSHEIRTPMNGIIGMTDLMLLTELNEDQKDFLSSIRVSAELLLKIINDILDFSKIEAGKLELESVSFNIREIIEKTIGILAVNAHEKGLELNCYIESNIPECLIGDSIRLQQVLYNLIGNAVKFTQNGEVDLFVKKIDNCNENIELKFTMSDTGIGIPQEKIHRLFKSFSQIDDSYTRKFGGTGLGLAISKQIIENMGGSIWVESEVGKGSTFTFTVRFRAQPEAVDEENESLSDIKGKKALVVDDNETNRVILNEILSRAGLSVALTSSGIDCISILNEDSGFDIVLLDFCMPDMDGLEVVNRIKQNPSLRDITIMMLTSIDTINCKSRCRELGVSEFLVKPVRRDELFSAIIKLLRGTKGVEAVEEQSSILLNAGESTGCQLDILVAEDNVINRKLAVALLENKGHRVTAVMNGVEVLKAMEQQKFDMLLIDVQMPEMDGFTTTIAIREMEKLIGEHMPIIAITAYAMKGDREKCIEAGMDDYISKPVNTGELYSIIDKYLAAGCCHKCHDEISAPLDLSYLFKAINYDDELLKELVNDILSFYPEQIERMKTAVNSNDMQLLSQVAHGFKGAISNFNAGRAYMLACELENLKNKSGSDNPHLIVKNLQKEMENIKEYLQDYIKKLQVD